MSTSLQQRQTARPQDWHPLVRPGGEIRIRPGSSPYDLGRGPSCGPIFATYEHHSCKAAKEQAWRHATDGKQDIWTGITSAVRSILREARDCYDYGTFVNLDEDKFLDIIVKDVCFFLQLVLVQFGAQLGYPPEHPFFGSNRNENELREWLASLFIVGNQIPLVVFERLMGQDFFQQAMERTTNWKKPVGLIENVLYEFLLVPASNKNQRGQKLSTCLQTPLPAAIDLLHGLYLMVLGPRNDPNEEYVREVRIRMGSTVDNADNAMSFRNAKALSEEGVGFKGVDGLGIRGISFERRLFKGILCLPLLVVDESTQLLFRNLEDYELVQPLVNPEVGSYLKFMKDLVPEIEDAQTLESQGAIKGLINSLPRHLMYGSVRRDIGLSTKLYDIKLQINHYSRPWLNLCPWLNCRPWLNPKLKTCVKYSISVFMMVGPVFGLLAYLKK